MSDRHMKQSINGCVTCSRKWSDHTPAERGEATPDSPSTEAGRAFVADDSFGVAGTPEARAKIALAIEAEAHADTARPSTAPIGDAYERGYSDGWHKRNEGDTARPVEDSFTPEELAYKRGYKDAGYDNGMLFGEAAALGAQVAVLRETLERLHRQAHLTKRDGFSVAFEDAPCRVAQVLNDTAQAAAGYGLVEPWRASLTWAMAEVGIHVDPEKQNSSWRKAWDNSIALLDAEKEDGE